MSTKRIDRLFHFLERLPASDRTLLKGLIVLSFIAGTWALLSVSAERTVEIPERGGALTEGIVGTPRFINPLLAVTAADKDVAALVYAGLMRLGNDGVVHPDMAESVTVSEDGLTYNVILKDGLTFHDGTPVSADDVIFTVTHIQDPALKSPLRGNWDGVSMERISEKELNFVLEQAYTPFVENLTVGILPRHIWEFATPDEVPFSQHNSEPIGSGPYMIGAIERNRSGIPDAYVLEPFPGYHGKKAQIDTLSLKFFQNEPELINALTQKTIDSASGLSKDALAMIFQDPDTAEGLTLHRTPLPRTFVLFLNQNENPAFRDISVRRALNAVIDRERIVQDILGGYGVPIDGPVPPEFGVESQASTTPPQGADAAREILRSGGWKLNETSGLWEKKSGTETMELKFSIATPNTALFADTAELLKATWEEVGIPVDVKRFEQSDLTQTIIRPRKYEALLFGMAVGRELDFYSFWHSSQRNDPGLNVALYANITTDALLSDVRTKLSAQERALAYTRFADEMRADVPALFLFVPEFTYIVPSRIRDVSLKGLAQPSERWSGISDWYADTEYVWPIFTDSQ